MPYTESDLRRMEGDARNFAFRGHAWTILNRAEHQYQYQHQSDGTSDYANNVYWMIMDMSEKILKAVGMLRRRRNQKLYDSIAQNVEQTSQIIRSTKAELLVRITALLSTLEPGSPLHTEASALMMSA